MIIKHEGLESGVLSFSLVDLLIAGFHVFYFDYTLWYASQSKTLRYDWNKEGLITQICFDLYIQIGGSLYKK